MGILSVTLSAVTNNIKSSFIFTTIFISFIIICNSNKINGIEQQQSQDKIEIEQITYCDENVKIEKDISNRYVYITTLDGKLSALDLLQGGNVKWAIPTGGPLLSSSIHQLELTKNGQWVRMIPSLSGGLYQFDGDRIEPIPITAENLLSSSFKFSDDLVISGGKETRTYGVSARTGQVIYECSMHGCNNNTESDNDLQEETNENNINMENLHNPSIDDVIVLRRETQTVRAIEPRTGSERWNFSVGHQDIELLKSTDCHTMNNLDDTILDLELKIIVPDGIICAVNKKTPNQILWKYKFDYPIVSAWRNDKNNLLENIDLFTSSISQWKTNYEHLPSNKEIPVSPSVYVGMFMKQLYVQESENLRKLIHSEPNKKNKIKYPSIPWKPHPATSSALALIEDDNKNEFEQTNEIKSESTTTAISILYGSSYVNGNGFFLYTANDLNKTQTAVCDSDSDINSIENNRETLAIDSDGGVYDFPFVDDDTPARIVIVSLWFWWKEILLIAITTAIIVNVMLSQKMRNEREVVVVERHVEIPIIIEKEISKEDSKSRNSQRSLSESNNNSDNFTSRFLNDFIPVQCLGKGGFGVVFEAKNKLDDCNYAIKRIVLPNKQESRDKIMREVKTLANCEHHNIVRYFQAWVETPPLGWQEDCDQLYFERDLLSTSIEIETPTDLSTQPKLFTNELIKYNKLDSWITNLNTNECINFDDEIRKTTFNHNQTNNCIKSDDDSGLSFIQFNDDNFSNSIFRRKNKNGNRFYNDDNGQDDDDDDDSFKIEFRNDSRDSSISKNVNLNNNNDCSISITNNRMISDDDDDDDGNNDDNLKIVPFKKTHRRPLSLDLTNKECSKFLPSNKMYLYIQMQLCRKQSLKDWLKLNDLNARQDHILKIFQQIIDAVEYVHLKGLIHRDLKPSNIFFSLDGQIKIGDFGLVTDTTEILPNIRKTICNEKIDCIKHTEQVGTHLYMSPEQLNGLPYNYKVDIYSIGLILFELLVVFNTEMERIDTLKKLRLNQFPEDFQKSFSKEYHLLQLMLSQSPHERPTTFGIRSRPPLEISTNPDYHFELPSRRHESRTSSISNNSSN